MVKRRPGEKNREWMTKALILLYIANNGPVQTDDVREYLRTLDKKPVKSKTLIYKHLKELEVKHRLLRRISSGHGKTDSFIIIEGFEGLKNAYMFMEKANYEKELLITAYYQDYIQTDDFREKIRIHFFKENLLKIYSAIKDEDKYKHLVDELGRSPGVEAEKCIEAVKMIKNGGDSKPITRELTGLFKTIESNDVDQLYQIFKDRLQPPANNTLPSLDPQKYMENLTNLLIPENQRDNFKLILSSSPSAIKFILTKKYYDSNTMFHNLAAYFTLDQTKDYAFLSKLFHYNPELDEGINLDLIMPIENIDMDILTTKTTKPWVNKDSSFMAILRSYLIVDLADDNIIRENYTQERLKQIFPTNPQTDQQTIGTKVGDSPTKNRIFANKKPANNKSSSTKKGRH